MRRDFLKSIVGGAAVLTLGARAGRAQGVLTLRDHLVISSSTTAALVTQALARAFADRHPDVRAPEVNVVGSIHAMEDFCSGIGPSTPDLILTTRRMSLSMREVCLSNGVREVVKLRLGIGAMVLAARRGDQITSLSTRQVYEAVAAEHASADGFVANRLNTWRQVDTPLPPTPIKILVPPTTSGTRSLFDDLVLEAGCRSVRDIRLLFEASYRRTKCVTMRTDGRVVEVPERDMAATLLASPPGTLAVTNYGVVAASGGNLIPVALDGDLPTPANIISMDYDQVRTIFLYVKRQHSRNVRGIGVVRGIAEMMQIATSEAATGPGGYIADAGLFPLPPAERIAQRRISERMTLMPMN